MCVCLCVCLEGGGEASNVYVNNCSVGDKIQSVL